MGKTADEAYDLFQKFKRLEDAGAFSAECEVIPENVMGEISKRTDIVTVSYETVTISVRFEISPITFSGITSHSAEKAPASSNLLNF